MPDSRPFHLASKSIAALPIVNHFLARLHVPDLFAACLPPPDPRSRVDPAATLGAFLRCLTIARTPLYPVIEWARAFHPLLLGCPPEQLNDDRIGRSLDRLFDADRCALLTAFVLHMLEQFAISPQELHNDSSGRAQAHGGLQGQFMTRRSHAVSMKCLRKAPSQPYVSCCPP